MGKVALRQWFTDVKKSYQYLTEENFYRIAILHHGIHYRNVNSYPNLQTRIEVIFSAINLTSKPLLTLFRPSSPFQVIDTGSSNRKIMLYKEKYVDILTNYESKTYDMREPEPFYFYVREINGDLVLKLNPIQLCDFFQNINGNLPCSFCFRNDMVSRFKNVTAEELLKLIKKRESRNDYRILGIIDEVSLITGSYKSNRQYLKETTKIIRGLKPYIPKECKITIGSHEANGRETFEHLRKIGVTNYAFPIETFTDEGRQKGMKNRKGKIPIQQIIQDIKEAITVFGEDNVIIRVVAGMGDSLDKEFEKRIKHIALLGKSKIGPLWNVNIYMPFTHYHWRLFDKEPPFTLDYLFQYCSILNQYIPKDRFYQFKISP